jgi:hypothetical protein
MSVAARPVMPSAVVWKREGRFVEAHWRICCGEDVARDSLARAIVSWVKGTVEMDEVEEARVEAAESEGEEGPEEAEDDEAIVFWGTG